MAMEKGNGADGQQQHPTLQGTLGALLYNWGLI